MGTTPAVLDVRAALRSRLAQVGAVFVGTLIACACGSSTTTVTSPSTIQRCGVTIGATDATIPAAGGNGRVTVTTARECAWTAATEVGWLSIVGPNSGQGDGAIDFRVSANSDPVMRRGGIVLNDQRAEITQSAGACSMQLRQPSASFPQSGGTGAVEVVASSQLCTWTAVAEADWITITSSANGTGTASVTFTVGPTSGPPRTASIRIGEQRFSITQSEGCSYSISPQAFTTGAAGGSGTIAISTSSACPWTTLSNAPWINVTQGASGMGPGSVAFTVEPTSGPSRTGTLVAAGHAFVVSQSTGCSFDVSPLTQSAPAAGGNLVVQVAAAPGCGWTATSSVSWIAVVGSAAGSGSGTVTLQVAASTAGARNGTVTVADKTVTISQASGCTFAINPQSQTVPSAGGTGSVNVTAPQGCGWNASSQADWITITTGSTGSGNGTVQFSVAATTGSGRSGTLVIAGHTFTVTQAESCTITLAPDSVRVPEAGGPSTFNVQTGASCAWTAASQASWITITSGDRGTGTQAVQLSVASHSGERRTGTVAVTGPAGVPPVNFTVVQESGCTVTLAAQSVVVPASGGPGSVDVASDSTCEWNVRTEDTWISVTSGPRGSGSAAVTFQVTPNMGAARSGVIKIGPRNFTVNQESGCTFSIAPTSQGMPASGGETNVTVTGQPGCGWSASTATPWISILSGASGTGGGVVQMSIAANVDAARSGTVTIAGLTFTVNQASGCTYTVSPSAIPAAAGGGPGTFNVATSGPGCGWTAVPDVPWISITGSATGTGGGAVNFTVQPNPGAARSGTINVQGQIVTISQGGM